MSVRKHLSQDKAGDYQRWEPSALDTVPNEDDLQQVQLTTAEAVEQIHQQAYQEGYDAGFEEGKAAGYDQGRAQVVEELQRMRALLGSVAEAVQQFGQSLSEDMLALALDVSRQMLRQALKVNPELLLPIVRSAMESLPQNSQHPHVHLHPEDAALVRTHMHAEISQGGWKIVEDHRIERGGCRIETPVAEIDATLPSRWQRLAAGLGQDSSWLDQ